MTNPEPLPLSRGLVLRMDTTLGLTRCATPAMVSGARLGTSLGTSLFNALAPCGAGVSSPVREAPTTPPTPADTAATTATTSSTAHRGRPPLRRRGADAWAPWSVAAAGHGPVGGLYGGCHGPGPPAEAGAFAQV